MKNNLSVLESITRLEGLIQWASEQPRDACPSRELMEEKIGVDWGDLPLCDKYQCANCPLAGAFGKCGSPGAKNAWGRLDASSTWAVWLKGAYELLKQFRSL